MTSGKRLAQRTGERGFAYVFAMILVAVVGLALTAYAQTASHARQREREAQLLWAGEQYRHAIGLYYERTPGAAKHYPERLEELLRDSRYLAVQRYLRELYPDPMSGKARWGTMPAPGGGIMGVYSLSAGRPIKTGGFSVKESAFAGAMEYSAWVFSYEPPVSPRPSAVRLPKAP